MNDTMEPAGATISPGSRVRLHFSLALVDGTVAVSTFDEQPAVIVMGDGSLAEGLELALYGLSKGDTQTLTLAPGQAFGPREEEKVQQMQRSDFPSEMELERGLLVAFDTPSGDEVAGRVLEIGERRVTMDFNHPLAGQQIVFRVEILDIPLPQTVD